MNCSYPKSEGIRKAGKASLFIHFFGGLTDLFRGEASNHNKSLTKIFHKLPLDAEILPDFTWQQIKEKLMKGEDFCAFHPPFARPLDSRAYNEYFNSRLFIPPS